MNDSCMPLASEMHPHQDRSFIDTIIEKFTPDNSAQELELCRGRAKTPFADLVGYGSDVTSGRIAEYANVQMHITDHGHTAYDTNASGNHRLLFRTSKDATFNTQSEGAYKYDDQGRLTEVLEHSASPKFETIRKSSLTPAGWKEEQWNRYGTQFNKMPTTTGQTEFQAQTDGTVLRIIRTMDTPMGAAPVGRPTVEVRTVYDTEGRVVTLTHR